MEDLTERQAKILKAIIEEFIETASPVGSETIEKKYNLGVSPATIRNEMVKLTDQGYLKKSHSSSGRNPSPQGLKYYVDHLMKAENLTLAEEVAVKEKVWDYRNEFEKLLHEATKELSKRTKMLSLATSSEGDFFSSGLGNILDAPEFYDIDLTKTILSYLDQFDYWQKLIERTWEGEDPIHILLGDEFGLEAFEPCGFIYTSFRAGSRSGAIGVVGPARVKYSRVVPVVKYFGQLIEEVGKNW